MTPDKLDPCPDCGRSNFTSKPGRTLHMKKCCLDKMHQEKTNEILSSSDEIDKPCPKCKKNDFSSKSGRTLHIKSCKGKPPVRDLPQKDTTHGENLGSVNNRLKGSEKEGACPRCGAIKAFTETVQRRVFGVLHSYLKCSICKTRTHLDNISVVSDEEGPEPGCWATFPFLYRHQPHCPTFDEDKCIGVHKEGDVCPAKRDFNHMSFQLNSRENINI